MAEKPKTPKAKEAHEPEVFTPPLVVQGDWVDYSPDGRFETSRIVQVSSVTGDALNLRDFGGHVILGVRHDADPILKQWPEQRQDNGAWRLTPSALRMAAIESTLESLIERVTLLETTRP